MQISIRELKNKLSKYLYSTKPQSLPQPEGVKWNGKKPLGGGKNRPKISNKTAAEYALEDRNPK